MFKKIPLLVFCLQIFTLGMYGKGPVMHAYLAHQWMSISQKYDDKAYALFMAGTLFPDIRYPAHIDKKLTHLDKFSLDFIVQESDYFRAGMKFHHFVDHVGFWLFESKGLQFIGKKPELHFHTFLKLVEDNIVYDLLDRQKVISIIATVLPEEQAVADSLGILPETLELWHQRLREHFSFRSTEIIQKLASENKGYLENTAPETVKTWNTILSEVVKDERLQKYVRNMIKTFTQLFESALNT